MKHFTTPSPISYPFAEVSRMWCKSRSTFDFAALWLLAMLPGLAWAQEVDCTSPVAQVEINYCAEQDFLAADAELNAVYKGARDRMREVDAGIPAAERGAELSLRDAQRAWITFRDQACTTEAYTWFGGSGAPMIYSGCRARITQQRVMDLRGLVEGY